MADCAAEGVVDQWGKVFGHRGLFVVDGAAIPHPIGLNPARTISAVAERMAACRVASRGRLGRETVRLDGRRPGRGSALGCMRRVTMRYSRSRLGKIGTETRTNDHERPPA